MGVKDVCTGINVHDFSANDRCISWKWTPLVLGTLSNRRIDSVSIETRYVLSVMRLEASSTCCNIDISKLKSNKFALVIRSIDRSGGGIWKIQTWNCICQPVDIDSYYNKIKLYRELGCPFRPQSLLVFINPYGGRRQAEVIYYSSVRPILDLVGIRSKVIVTTHQGHCQEYVLSEDLSPYDGVLAVGGDGLFSELLHGLLYRTRKDAKLPLYENHKPFSTELTPQLKIGLIPAENSPDFLRIIYGDVRVKRAGLKTGCRIEVTRRILRRLVSPGNWIRLSILRVTGPDEKSIAQFNRLVEACVPLHSHRIEYPKRNAPTLLSRPPNQLEMGSPKSTPKAWTHLTPMKRNVCTPLPANSPLNDLVHSGNASSDNNRPNSASPINAPRKIASHIRSKDTPKPKPRVQSKILPESSLLSSPMKDMVTFRKQLPGTHSLKPGSVVIIRQSLEKQTPRATFATPVTTDRPASGVGILRFSNLRNATAIGNTKRLHLSKSKINEFESGQAGGLNPSSPRKPRRPRSLVMKNRLQSSSDAMPSFTRESSHHSKKEMRQVPHIISPLVSAGPKAEHKKSKRMRKSPVSNASSPERSSAKQAPSISPSKLNDRTRQELENVSRVLIGVEDETQELLEPSNSSIPKARPNASAIAFEAKSQANRTFESSMDKLPRDAVGKLGETTDDKPKIPLKAVRSPTPKIKTPKLHTRIPLTETEMLGILRNAANANIESFAEKVVDRLVVEYVDRATNSEADALLTEQSIMNTTSLIDTSALVSSGPIKIKDVVDLIHEVSGSDTAKSNLEELADVTSRPQSILRSPIIEQVTEGLNSDRVCDITEDDFSTARANSHESTESKSKSIKRAQLPHSQLSFVDHVQIDTSLGILKALEFPVYEEGTNTGVDVKPRVCQLIEHVISVLSEEIMPSPMSSYEVNYSNAKSHGETKHESRVSKNVNSFSMPLPSKTTSPPSRMDRILYFNSFERQIIVGDENTSQFEYEFGEKLADCENRGELPPSPPATQESHDQNQNQPYVGVPGEEIRFSLSPEESEPVKMNPEESPKAQENQRLELQKRIVVVDGGDCVKGNPVIEENFDANGCTAVKCEVIKEKANCIFVKFHQFGETTFEYALPSASTLVELKSPKQMTTDATIEGRKNEGASPAPNSLPTSTSSVPLELPGASDATECGGQQILQHSIAERFIKSAGASPLCFDSTLDISKSGSAHLNEGTNSHRDFLQDFNASTAISADLEDQENTHNANTDFSNKGKMESPISFTPITDLQGESCGTSTMESFYRVMEPALGLEERARGHIDDTLADSTFNVSETSNATTYASSLKSELFY